VTLDATHACVVDLDGVVWLAGDPLPGAAEGVAELRRRGIPVLFATNNAAPTIRELQERLGAMGIRASPDEIATSSQAVASMLVAGERAYVVGASGLREALDAAGVEQAGRDVDAVVIGLTMDFDYAVLETAATLARDGARLLAANTDPTLPGAHGLRPGAGAIVAAISTAAGKTPEVAGKPHAPMCRLVLARSQVGAVVGDRASTDGAFADALGVPFAHVRSDVAERAATSVVEAATLLDAVLALCA
jgi:HAD superfamily hydrolase (TIGR01450 family)